MWSTVKIKTVRTKLNICENKKKNTTVFKSERNRKPKNCAQILSLKKMNGVDTKMIKSNDESTVISTMARLHLKTSNFSINAILPEITRETPQVVSPAPSMECDDASSNEDVNVDYESDIEGELSERRKPTLLCNFMNCESISVNLFIFFHIMCVTL